MPGDRDQNTLWNSHIMKYIVALKHLYLYPKRLWLSCPNVEQPNNQSPGGAWSNLSRAGTHGLHGAGGAGVAEAGPTGPSTHTGRVWGPTSTAGLGLARFHALGL